MMFLYQHTNVLTIPNSPKPLRRSGNATPSYITSIPLKNINGQMVRSNNHQISHIHQTFKYDVFFLLKPSEIISILEGLMKGLDIITLHVLVRRFYPKRLTYSILWAIPTRAIWGECLAQGHNDMLTAVGFEPVLPWSEYECSSHCATRLPQILVFWHRTILEAMYFYW